jgi:RHS repeat-associated protein
LTDPTVYQKSSSLDQTKLEAQGLLNNQISGATFPLPNTGLLGGSTPGSTYATRTVDFPRYVVSGYAKSDGRGNQYDYGYVNSDSGYFYTGAKIDLTGRGWLGYESIASPDNNLQTITATEYNQDFPLTNTVSGSVIYRSSDKAMMKATVMSYTQPVENSDTQTVLVTAMQTRLYNFAPAGSQPDSTHLKTCRYDDYGNATATADSSSDEGSLPLYIFESYSNNTDQWRLGYKTEIKKSSDSAGDQIISWEQMEYDPDTQNLTAHSAWDDQKEQWLVSTFGYDEYGNRTTGTDPSGAQGVSEFDPTYHSFIVKSISPANQSGESLVTQFDYWWQFGAQKSKTAPVVGSESGAGPIVWQQNTDGLGRVIEMLGPDPADNLVVLVRRSWNSSEQGDFEETLTLLDWQSEETQWNRQYFDGLERVYRSVVLGPDGITPVIVDKTLDSMGNPKQLSLPYYEGQTPAFINRTYDNYERLIEEVKPTDGGGTATTTWAYVNSNEVTQTDAAGTANSRQMAFEYCTYNSKRVIIKRTDADGGVTTFYYDPLGRLISSVDPIGVTNAVTHDSLNRQTILESKSADKVLYYESFSYDDLNRTLTHQDALLSRIVISFDALRRIISKTVGSQSPTLFVYDDSDQANSTGRLSRVTMPEGSSYQYAYDLYGNQTTTTLNLDNQSYSFRKTYTPTRQVEQLTYPDNFAVTNSYNAANQLTSVAPSESGVGNPDSFAAFSQFTLFGQSQAVSYGNSVQELFTFNHLGQLKSQVLSGAGGTALINTTFNWDNLDQLVEIDDQIDSQKSQAFTYDAVGRLAKAAGDFTTPQVFAYDTAGNLTLKDGITYSHDGFQVQQGMQNGGGVFGATYDADGNMTSTTHLGTKTTYEYDQERQLIQTGTTSFTYDYTGRRLIKRTADGPATYYVSPYYEVTTFPDGSSQHTKSIVGKNGLIATITTVDSGKGNPPAAPFVGVPVAGTFYFHKNQINSTTVQTDDQGNASTTVEYCPFGEINSISGPDTFRQKFAGREMDSETGLYYLRARYYDPVIGRFITADDQPGGPLHRHDAFNRYAYVLNNPVTCVDPMGHSVFSSSSHFFTNTVPHAFGHDVKGFFTGDVKHAFTNKIAETVLSYTLDGALIVAGCVVLAGGTAVGAGPAATVVGSTLLGAGVGGLTYNLTHQNWKTGTVSGNFSWRQYWANVGIGAMTGFIAGGVAAGAGAAIGAAAEGGSASFMVGGVGRVAVSVAANAVGGAVAGFTGQIATNSLDHQSLWSGVGGATLAGGLLGGASAAASEGISYGLAKNFSSEASMNELVFSDQIGEGVHSPGWQDALERIQAGEVEIYVPTKLGNFLISLPGLVFTGIGVGLVVTNLQPDW